MSKRGSKRKPELDLEAERSSYASFVAAANAVSQLYTAGVREQRRTAKNTLEKVLAFVLREHPNSDYIPKPVLLQWLQHEYERADHPDAVVPPGAQGLLPFMVSAASAASSGDEGPDTDHGVMGSGGKAARANSIGRSRGCALAGAGGGAGEDVQQQYMQQQFQAVQGQPFHQQAAHQEQQQQYQNQQYQQQQYQQQAAPEYHEAANPMETSQQAFGPHFG